MAASGATQPAKAIRRLPGLFRPLVTAQSDWRIKRRACIPFVMRCRISGLGRSRGTPQEWTVSAAVAGNLIFWQRRGAAVWRGEYWTTPNWRRLRPATACPVPCRCTACGSLVVLGESKTCINRSATGRPDLCQCPPSDVRLSGQTSRASVWGQNSRNLNSISLHLFGRDSNRH